MAHQLSAGSGEAMAQADERSVAHDDDQPIEDTARAPASRQSGRRTRILRAAAEIIGEQGVCDTRIADIAERAGVSPGLAVYYFESKDRLLTEALTFSENRFYDETMADLAGLSTSRERLVRLIERSCPMLDDDTNYAEWTLWVELWSRALRDPAIRERREALDRRWRETIASIVREGRRNMEFAPIDVDDFVQRLAGLIDGLVIQVILGDPTIGPERMREVVVGMTARELGFEAQPR
jgi:AcrR family transcriptional regulator